MSFLGTAAAITAEASKYADKAYDIFTSERAFNNQASNNAWNSKYAILSSLWNRQNQEKDIATLFAREDSAWQRAVADIQKAGLSTTMLSGGAGSGIVSGHGASSAPSLGSGKFQSGATVGSVMDMYGQYLGFKQTQEQTKLIKDQQNYYKSLRDKVDNDKHNDNIRTVDTSAKTKAEIESMNASTQGRLITNQSDAIGLKQEQEFYDMGLNPKTGKLDNPNRNWFFSKHVPFFGFFERALSDLYYKRSIQKSRGKK